MKIGQEIWLHTYRGSIVETTIATVGRKYFTVSHHNYSSTKFHKDTLREANSIGDPMFIILDLDKYYDEQYCNKLARNLIRFDWNKLNKEELEKVLDVVRKYMED